jgi:hypothetical protein
MRHDTAAQSWPPVGRSLLGALCLLVASCGPSARAGDRGGINAVAQGMSQTDLQSVLGPPDYIQVNGTRQAWQYCPHFMERLFQRNGNLIVTLERLIAREGGNFYITVWFVGPEVVHMRAYPEESMGSCADFYAAFRWDDTIDGEFIGSEGYGAYVGEGK